MPLLARTSLVRKTPLVRKTRMRVINKARKRRAWERNFGLRRDAVTGMRCLATVPALFGGMKQCSAQPDAAHVIARGMGGAKGDRRDLVPLCRAHHREAGEARTSKRAAFEEKYGLDLQAEAARIAAELDERGIAMSEESKTTDAGRIGGGPPSIVLRDGFAWHQDREDGTWEAVNVSDGDTVEKVMWAPKKRHLVCREQYDIGDCSGDLSGTYGDVVLAVIAANAPDLLTPYLEAARREERAACLAIVEDGLTYEKVLAAQSALRIARNGIAALGPSGEKDGDHG